MQFKSMLLMVLNFVQQTLCNTEEEFCPTNPDGNKFMIIKDYKNNRDQKV